MQINWPNFSDEASNFHGNLNISDTCKFSSISVLRNFNLIVKFSRNLMFRNFASIFLHFYIKYFLVLYILLYKYLFFNLSFLKLFISILNN